MSTRSCQRCGFTDNGPDNFQLTCRTCKKTWHHRCLMPPMEDQDLIRLITATTSGDTDNDLNSWTCRRCKKRASNIQSATSESQGASKTDVASVRIKQELCNTGDVQLGNDHERNKSDRQDSTNAAVGRHTLATKRTRPSAAVQSRSTPTQSKLNVPGIAQEMEEPPPTHSHPFKAARKFIDTSSTTSSEADVEMMVDSPTPSESTSRAASQASHPPPSSRSTTAVETDLRGTSSTSERSWGVGPAVGVVDQPPANQIAADEVDDDPEDLYGPPVERRIVRILPSLAEELRDQQRRVAAEKEKRRTPLASDWILARHVDDPLWKEIPTTEGRKRRKQTSKKLGENGINANELLDCYTVRNWVREHKTS